jgi:excisionase family DNA binding protein
MGATPQEVASTFAVMAAAMLAEACGGTAKARRLAARWTRKITARETRAVIARNASTASLVAAFVPPPRQLAARLGVSRETVRRLAIAGALPHTVVCRGTRKTTRRYPRRFADDFAASGLDMADLAVFAAQWRARVTAPGL